MAYGNIIFDLDGTIVDTMPGITRSLKAIMKDFGEDNLSDDLLRAMVGPPLKDAFINVFSMDGDTADKAVSAFRKVYTSGEMLTAELFDGVKETLEKLKGEGYSLYVATSKPEPFAKRILSHLGVDVLFDYVAGSSTDGVRTKKADIIEYLLKETGKDGKDCLMVGDKALDVVGAAKFGIDTVLVSYGYATAEELEKSGAIAVIDSFPRLRDFLEDKKL